MTTFMTILLIVSLFVNVIYFIALKYLSKMLDAELDEHKDTLDKYKETLIKSNKRGEREIYLLKSINDARQVSKPYEFIVQRLKNCPEEFIDTVPDEKIKEDKITG